MENEEGFILDVPEEDDDEDEEELDDFQVKKKPFESSRRVSELYSSRSSFRRMSTNSKHRPSAFGICDKVTVKAATKEQKKEIKELVEEGKFDDEDIEKLSEESATYILIYEKNLKETREHIEELELRLEGANEAEDRAKDKANSLQDTIYTKDNDIERLVKKITDIRIEQAEEMNSIIMRFKSLEEKEIENRQKISLKNKLQLE